MLDLRDRVVEFRVTAPAKRSSVGRWGAQRSYRQTGAPFLCQLSITLITADWDPEPREG